MKAIIECIPRREGGSSVTLNGRDYFFEPQTARGPHVAEVTVVEDYERFTEISDYRVLTVDWEGQPDPVTASAANGLKPASQDDQAPQTTLTTGPTSTLSNGDEYSDKTDDELADLHVAEFGQKPHWKAKRSTVIASLKNAHADSD